MDDYPDWCWADPAKIVYEHWAQTYDELLERGRRQIWILDLHSGERTYLTNGWFPDWSPDGDQICSIRHANGRFEVWITDVESGEQWQLTDSEQLKAYPSWSPTERTIAYSTSDHTQEEPSGIWLVDIDTRDRRHLCSGGDPAWSPDRKRMAFMPKLKIIDIHAPDNPEVLVDGGVTNLVWAPSSNWIMYHIRYASDDDAIATIDLTTETIGRVAGAAWSATVSPDEQRIVFSRMDSESGVSVLCIMNRDGTACSQLTRHEDYYAD